MKVSIIQLTWNRLDLTKAVWEHNVSKASRAYDELLWLDNGSTDGTADFAQACKPDVLILHKENRGVPVGLNSLYALATMEAVTWPIYAFMPDQWLDKMLRILENSDLDFVACYSEEFSDAQVPRYLGEPTKIDGVDCIPAQAFEYCLMRRTALRKVGYLRPEFGMYGWSDEEWYCRANHYGLRGVALGEKCHRASNCGMVEYRADAGETPEQFAWKKAQLTNDQPHLLEKLRGEGFPFFSPF